MIDRRSFMQSSVACGAALATWSVHVSSRPAGAANLAASIVLVDRHLEGATEFAADARSQGLDTFDFTGDVAGLWMRELEPRLRAGPVTIAGRTSAATLFCLDFLARDYGARTVERVADGAVIWVISSTPGRRAPLAPVCTRTRSGDSHA